MRGKQSGVRLSAAPRSGGREQKRSVRVCEDARSDFSSEPCGALLRRRAVANDTARGNWRTTGVCKDKTKNLKSVRKWLMRGSSFAASSFLRKAAQPRALMSSRPRQVSLGSPMRRLVASALAAGHPPQAFFIRRIRSEFESFPMSR